MITEEIKKQYTAGELSIKCLYQNASSNLEMYAFLKKIYRDENNIKNL